MSSLRLQTSWRRELQATSAHTGQLFVNSDRGPEEDFPRFTAMAVPVSAVHPWAFLPSFRFNPWLPTPSSVHSRPSSHFSCVDVSARAGVSPQHRLCHRCLYHWSCIQNLD